MRTLRAYLRAHGHRGKANAVKQSEIFLNTGIDKREIRQQVEDINGDRTIKDMVSFGNGGIFLVETNEELRTLRARAKRALERNKVRMEKADMLLAEKFQMAFAFDWDDDEITQGRE